MERRHCPKDSFGRPLLVMGPPGASGACGRFAITLDQVGDELEPGIPCWHCGEGRFRHRSLWRYAYCPACDGSGCEGCGWSGIVATPRE